MNNALMKEFTVISSILAVMALTTVLSASAAQEQPLTDAGKPGRTEIGFNADWRFMKGSLAGAEAMAFDDAKWERVRLPHDWAVFGPFIQELNGGSGKVQWQGIAWYRKHFRLPATTKGKRIFLDFDGVLAAPKVYVNGKLAGQCEYGYMSFRVDATPYLTWSGENVVAVSADTTAHGTRWYPGAGIYRKVTLVICEPVHVAQWGTQITTPVIKGKEAEVRIRTTVISKLPRTKAKVALESVVFNPEGAEVGRVKTEAQLQGGYYRVYEQSVTLREIQLWDFESPKLYKVRSLVWVEDKLMDSYESPFGIRSIEWTAEDGFHLNGRRVQLNGVNLHHDQGPLGAAFYRRAMERQLELLKEAGVNAVRTSHNVQSPELLELCDQLGILVYNEAFDKWNGLTDRDFGMKTLLDFVRRDRNHPSAICWSIGNEIPQSLDPFQANHVKLFYGKAMLIVRSVPNQIGSVQVTATSKGLGDGKVPIETTLTKPEIHL